MNECQAVAQLKRFSIFPNLYLSWVLETQEQRSEVGINEGYVRDSSVWSQTGNTSARDIYGAGSRVRG